MNNNSLLIWDWSSNSIVFDLLWFYSTSSNIKYLNSNLLASPGSVSSINIWNITSGQLEFTLNGSVYDLELLSSGFLGSTGVDNSIKIWNPANGQLLEQISVSESIN
jgi:WD40 repeat protein